jgi:hypothetical protein
MIRNLGLVALAASLGAICLSPSSGAGQGKAERWGTVKGRIVWGGKDIPKRKPVNATPDQLKGCGVNGPPLDETLVVNPNSRGIKWVAVSLYDPAGKLPVHPSLQAIKEKQVVMDQPRCMFIPRMTALREGQELLVKNSSLIVHNVRWIGNPDFNESGNRNIAPGDSVTIKGLKAQKIPLLIQCNIHGWMGARLAVYDHPYFAVTDEDGSFEIKLAPAGAYRLVAYQESIGWRGGAKGKNGEPITIKPGAVTDLGELKMGN